jgi:hypothetical protein
MSLPGKSADTAIIQKKPKGSGFDFEYIDHILFGEKYRIYGTDSTVSLRPYFKMGKERIFVLSPSTSCKSCIGSIPVIENLLNTEQDLLVLSLYQPQDADSLISRYAGSLSAYPNHITLKSQDQHFRKRYLMAGFPEGILFDENGLIIRDRLLPHHLIDLL